MFIAIVLFFRFAIIWADLRQSGSTIAYILQSVYRESLDLTLKGGGDGVHIIGKHYVPMDFARIVFHCVNFFKYE